MILAIDTATRRTGIALWSPDTGGLIDRSWTSTRRQTAELADTVQQLFATTDTTIKQLTGIAVAIGPGSYTGLRIGLGLAKGMILVRPDLAIAGIKTPGILAASMPEYENPLRVVLEAGRKRILVTPYIWKTNGWVENGEILNQSWAELIESTASPIVVAGEISDEGRKIVEEDPQQAIKLLPDEAGVRQPFTLAELGYAKIKRGEADDARSLTPIYLRNPDGS